MVARRTLRAHSLLWPAIALLGFGCGTDQRNGGAGASPEISLTHTCAAPGAELASDPRVERAHHELRDRTPDVYNLVLQEAEPTAGAYHVAFGFEHDGIPICAHRVRVHLLQDGSLTFTGDIPARVEDMGLSLFEAPPLPAQALLLSGEDRRILGESICLRPVAGRLEKIRRVHLLEGGRPMEAVLSGYEVESIEAVSFHATEAVGRIPSGKENFVEVPLSDVDDSGYLKSPRVLAFAPETYPTAFAPDGRFLYRPGDPRFAQVAAFVHAEQTIEWLSRPEHAGSLDCLPIELYLHDQDFRGINNNAEYLPPPLSPTGRAQVRIADGDGRALRNLALDPDVVAHELGHHVVYKSVRSSKVGARLLHEGMADFLQAAYAGDPCLGESICPADSEVCYVQAMCLRTADNDLKVIDAEYQKLDVHRRSQVLSGMLWELADAHLGLDYVTRATFTAILYLPLDADSQDLVSALIAADQELAGGANRCTILAVAKRRGLDVEACE